MKTGVKAGVTAGMAASAGLASAQAAADTGAMIRKGNIRQSVSRWCYKDVPLDDLCAYSAKIGLKGVDLLEVSEWDAPKKYGLICTMGYAGGGSIPDALNRLENHAAIEAAFRKNIPLAAKAGVPNVITFSGNRRGMSDEEGAKNCVIGLNRLKKIGEDNGVTICMELLNSKVNHKDYMCDHTAWGVGVMQEVNSPNVKLLYDIYHMQIMEGDLIRTITDNQKWLGHFHTGGVPGRHELNDQQEVQWDGVMRGILATGYKGYVAHEFVPTGDPLTSLRQAVELCDV
ncbi:Hydroxypyruvate isomerase [Acidisarcina polymorpha]|uniref:Hydroxypyruvate isomerase n=1 Tax=Acidisarcina polymorpha TaxID=2211140 RepID=A0A2Z5G2X2_9BACT|nr:TIM barrel protein [Acidisarcina polymorpha]AXC13448.1 Hydroxypyruvate isomerase [Acidisarcina polymorpha]